MRIHRACGMSDTHARSLLLTRLYYSAGSPRRTSVWKIRRKTSGWKMRLRMGGDCRESCVGCFFVVARGIPALLWRNCKGLREASNPIAVRCCPIISVEGRSWQWPEARDQGAALIKGVNSWMYRYRHLLIALHWFFFGRAGEAGVYGAFW